MDLVRFMKVLGNKKTKLIPSASSELALSEAEWGSL